MLELLGEPSALANTHAQTVMDIETALANASLTRVDRRDPRKLFHKLKLRQLQALTPSFRWSAYFASVDECTSVINVTSRVLRNFRRCSKRVI
jgi:endothelin-converting enzyme/putative endopeptidase